MSEQPPADDLRPEAERMAEPEPEQAAERAEAARAEARRHDDWLRRNMLAIMMSIVFAGGVLAGLVASTVGVDGVLVAPFVLAAAAGFFLILARR